MQGPLQEAGDLPFIDYQDQLPLPSTAFFPEPLEVETRQCLCLHVTAALTGERSLAGVRVAAVALRQEMLQESVEAFAHLGDAPPHVSEAEAFVRHNAHDCFYPHHEKDYRALALFAPAYLRMGRQQHLGALLSNMRLLDFSVKQYHALFGQLEQAGRLVREVEAQGWGLSGSYRFACGAAPFETRAVCALSSASDTMPRRPASYRGCLGSGSIPGFTCRSASCI